MDKEKCNNRIIVPPNCNISENKILGVVLIPETPFENNMSVSSHQEKRAENAKKALSNFKENVKNGSIIVIKP